MMDGFHDIPLHWIVECAGSLYTYPALLYRLVVRLVIYPPLQHPPPIFHITPTPRYLSTTCGISIPTLLAESLTLSSSSMFIPGLYLSSSTPYILCERRYTASCSASAGFCLPSAKASRRWLCSDERGALEKTPCGSSRRRER